MSNESRSDLLALLLKVLKCSLVLRNFGKENYFDSKMNTISNNYQNAASHVANISARWIGIRSTFLITY